MPWVNSKTLPRKKGFYKCLIEIDGFDTLSESKDEKFTGTHWDLFDSSCQFIRYWWATKKEYEYISKEYENDREQNIFNREGKF